MLFLLLFVFTIACNSTKNDPLNTTQDDFSFSSNKIWAHRVNTLEEIEKKHQLFEGMEVDLIYSNYKNTLYVAHDEKDTLRNILLEDWILHIPNPEKNWYWFDLKNLNKKNAKNIASLLVRVANEHGIFHKTICESKDVKALSVLKGNNLAVSYWISSDVSLRKFTGNIIWKKRIERKIAYLKPNALSSFSWMHPLLATSFPNENILYWHITKNKTPENVEFVRELCGMPNVKIVLVDYDEPIPYSF